MRSKNTLVVISAIVLIFSACQGGMKKGDKDNDDKGQENNSITFSSAIPHDVRVKFGFDYFGQDPIHQPPFDLFSWQSFVALNWPANSDGSPMAHFTDDPSAMRVWEYYADPAEVFGTNEQLLPFGGPFKQAPGLKGLRHFSKISSELVGLPDSIKAQIKEATGQPLIDRNLNFALYEIRLNKDEVSYIDSNHLNTKAGQVGKKISFPAGDTAGSVGAMEIKTTWKILDPKVDDTSTFYKRMAVIYVPADQCDNKGKPMYVTELVGLVGMHILHKTKSFKTWIWTTFEHVSNAPELADVGKGKNYSFYNAACQSCPVNTPITSSSFVWATTKPYAIKYATNGKYGTQAVRQRPVYGPTDSINKIWQRNLRSMGSVFANYRLIGSQWAASAGAITPPAPHLILAPDSLYNTTLETYIQNRPVYTNSCTGCHQTYARDAAGNPSDFSFILGHAH